MAVDVGRIGVWTSSRLLDGPAAVQAAAQLEELGYGALWIGSSAGDLRLVSDLLAATSRMVVATGIVNVWFDPAGPTAAAYARVARAHPDRLLLGIGAGHKSSVESVTGQRYERPYQKLVSYLDELDAADPPVPVDHRVLAALGPRVLRLARDRTAGAHPYLVTPEHTRRAREILGPGALLAPEQKVILETDPDRARRTARKVLAGYLALPNYTRNLLRLGFTEDDLTGGGSDRLVDALVAWGDTGAVVARVAEHHQAGADHVCIQALTETPGFPVTTLEVLAQALR
ncbi:MAG: LLM class F420-dependent oxidoreductase [Dactylosporangium sp.]|jgi:probable F420-dependent oxidoreductase|nr:LLM class F420-dependent oxidoreductase [Dactylosporangium sp.]